MEPWTAIEFVASSPSNQRPEFTYGHVLPEIDVVIRARSATFCVDDAVRACARYVTFEKSAGVRWTGDMNVGFKCANTTLPQP